MWRHWWFKLWQTVGDVELPCGNMSTAQVLKFLGEHWAGVMVILEVTKLLSDVRRYHDNRQLDSDDTFFCISPRSHLPALFYQYIVAIKTVAVKNTFTLALFKLRRRRFNVIAWDMNSRPTLAPTIGTWCWLLVLPTCQDNSTKSTSNKLCCNDVTTSTGMN